jgi:uncharacterized spore protein YtfJ
MDFLLFIADVLVAAEVVKEDVGCWVVTTTAGAGAEANDGAGAGAGAGVEVKPVDAVVEVKVTGDLASSLKSEKSELNEENEARGSKEGLACIPYFFC